LRNAVALIGGIAIPESSLCVIILTLPVLALQRAEVVLRARVPLLSGPATGRERQERQGAFRLMANWRK